MSDGTPTSRYRHYKNFGGSRDCVFVTTTCLDFMHVFEANDIRSLMAASLLDDCRFYHAPVYAFVIMPHHIHVLLQVPNGRDIVWLMTRIKSNSAKRILPRIDYRVKEKLSQQRGLNGREMWKAGFRGIVIDKEYFFDQKVDYIHSNPVRAGLAIADVDYYWSSARLYYQLPISAEIGIPISDELIAEFADRADLEFPKATRSTTEL